MTGQTGQTEFLRFPDPKVRAQASADRPITAPNDAKSLNLLLLDRSGSMSEEGKWQALEEAVSGLFAANDGNGAYFMRVFFEVNRARDTDFLPSTALLAKGSPGITPQGGTAFYDSGCRVIRYLLEALGRYPADKQPSASITMLTDGKDNKSKSGSQAALRVAIRGMLAEACPDGDFTKSKVMIIYWAFGDGSEQDRARHSEIAKSLGIPECWVRYSKGERKEILRWGGVMSDSIRSMTEGEGTQLLG